MSKKLHVEFEGITETFDNLEQVDNWMHLVAGDGPVWLQINGEPHTYTASIVAPGKIEAHPWIPPNGNPSTK